MKIEFTKLPATDGTIKVSLDGGKSFTDYSISDIHESGITLSDNQDYEKIQIKGPANLLKNLDIVSGIKVEGALNEEYTTYDAPLYIDYDYGNLYVSTDDIFYSIDKSDMYIYYNNKYYSLSYSDYLISSDLEVENCIYLNGAVIPVQNTFHISDGELDRDYGSGTVDPDNLVNILTYEKGIGGTATINGIEVNYKTDNPQTYENYDDSTYHWDSQDISGSYHGYLYRTKNGYETRDNVMKELRDSILSNGPVYVYVRLNNNEGFLKLPIKLS